MAYRAPLAPAGDLAGKVAMLANRLLQAPLRSRNALRSAKQMLAFVAEE